MAYFISKLFVLIILLVAIFYPNIKLVSDTIHVTIFLDPTITQTRHSMTNFDREISHIIKNNGYNPKIKIIRAGITHSSLTQQKLNIATNDNTKTQNWLEQAITTYLKEPPDKSNILILVSDFGENTNSIKSITTNKYSTNTERLFLKKIRSPAIPDAWIRGIKTYSNNAPNKNIPLKISVGTTTNTTGILSIYSNNNLINSSTVELYNNHNNIFHYELKLSDGMNSLLKVKINAKGDQYRKNNTAHAIITHNNKSKILYISAAVGKSQDKKINTVKNGTVIYIGPGKINKYLVNRSSLPSTIVMANVSLSSLDTDSLDRIVSAVKLDGVGLVVLGGDHAFSNGGYRKSQLEDILPLISESGKPDSDIAIDFIIDKSGSMSSPVGTTTRFDIAKESIIRTFPTFNTYDKVGIIAFDNKTHFLLQPTMNFKNKQLSLFKNLMPSGGSDLYPAMKAATNSLSKVKAHKRAIVILTDGFVIHSDFDNIKKQLRKSHIDIIVLAIGRNPNKKFISRISSYYGANVINVTNPVHLFKKLDIKLQKYRDSIVHHNSRTISVKPLPYQEAKIPPPAILKYYNVTKKQPSADMYIQTSSGDPVLASRSVGLGNTVAFTSGPDQISGNFLRELISMVDPSNQNQYTTISTHIYKNQLSIAIYILSHKTTDWDNTNIPKLTIRLPDNEIRDIHLNKILPGEFKTHLPLKQAGLYKISVTHSGNTKQQQFYFKNPDTADKITSEDSIYNVLIRDKLAKPYSDEALKNSLTPVIEIVHLRHLLLMAALLIYVIIISCENNILNVKSKHISALVRIFISIKRPER